VSGAGLGDDNDEPEPEQEPIKYLPSECKFESLGYRCCTTTCNVVYTDESGDWGVEFNDWCGIVTSICKGQSSSYCFSEKLGYLCCSGCSVIYTDSDGDWGVEKNNWCGIKDNCSSKPATTTTIKKTTTKTNINAPTTPTDNSKTPEIENYKLVFADEFEGNSLDRTKWDVEVNCWGGGNGEKQCYVDHEENIFVKDGQLHLKAVPKGEYKLTKEELKTCTNNNENSCSWAQSVTSGRIRTFKNGHAWKYGKVRVKAKLPAGPYLWPAIWMLPQDDVYGTWAASGEIDIMEARGQVSDTFGNAIHYGGQWPDNTYTDQSNKLANVINEFHVYGLDWERDSLVFSVDEKVTFTVDLRKSFWSGKGTNPYTDIRQPFDQRFHLLLNVAVGGNYFQGTFNYGSDTAKWTRPEMIVDYVRVYQKK